MMISDLNQAECAITLPEARRDAPNHVRMNTHNKPCAYEHMSATR